MDAKLNPSATDHQEMNNVPYETFSVAKEAMKMTRPADPKADPNAKSFLSSTLRATKRLANKNGKQHMAPNAIKLPAANGDQLKTGKDAPNTGKFASHAPSMNQHVIANQHMQSTTPHCKKDMWCCDESAASICGVTDPVVTISCPEVPTLGSIFVTCISTVSGCSSSGSW